MRWLLLLCACVFSLCQLFIASVLSTSGNGHFFLNIYIYLPRILPLSLLTELFPVIASVRPPQRAIKNNQMLPGSKTHFRPFRAISLKKGCVLFLYGNLSASAHVGLGRSRDSVYGAVTVTVTVSNCPTQRSHFQFYLWLYLLLCLC